MTLKYSHEKQECDKYENRKLFHSEVLYKVLI